MKINLKNIIVIALLLFGVMLSYAQNPTTEIASMLEQYKALTKVDINIQYYYYDSHNSKVVTEEALGIYQKEGNKMKIKQYGTEMINDGKYVLIKDDASKVITLAQSQEEQQPSFNIEQILSNYDRIEKIEAKKSEQKQYLIYFKKGGNSAYEKAKIFVNTNTNLLDEIVLYYSKAFDLSEDSRTNDYQKPKLRMVYTKVDTHPVFAKETFNVTKYVNLSITTKNTLKKQYGSYEFYDQTK